MDKIGYVPKGKTACTRKINCSWITKNPCLRLLNLSFYRIIILDRLKQIRKGASLSTPPPEML